MSSAPSPEGGLSSLALAQRIDQICDRFETHWKTGRRPRLELYVARLPPADQPALLRELLILEREYRIRAGELPALAEYLGRFVDQADVVQNVFAEAKPPSTRPAERVCITLTATAGPHQGQSYTYTGSESFLVGRSKRTHFALRSDQFLSRFHFLVEVRYPGCRLLDMGSRAGTCVNGQKVKTADLADGAEISAGRTVLRVAVRPLEPELPAAPQAAESLPELADASEPDSLGVQAKG